jgi:hypothetical protein
LTAFGGGAVVAAPLIRNLTHGAETFAVAPTRFSGEHASSLVTDDLGRQFVDIAGSMHEVVVATATDIAQIGGADAFGGAGLTDGIYLVGSGNSGGSAEALAVLGARWVFQRDDVGCDAYPGAVRNMAASRCVRCGWRGGGSTEEENTEKKKDAMVLVVGANVDHVAAMKTPQYWLLCGAVAGNAVGGMVFLSNASNIMGDCFGSIMSLVVTSSFAASYVAGPSAVASAGGRLGWASASDFLGRKPTFAVFGLGAPICAAIPTRTIAAASAGDGGGMNAIVVPLLGVPVSLAAFYGSTLVVISLYGGMFAVMPAYIADLFGQKYVAAIHGRVMTAWSFAAVSGPLSLTYLRASAHDSAIHDLAHHPSIGDARFEEAFGAPLSRLDELTQASAVTISRLLELVPPEVQVMDPTPTLYNSTIYGVSGMLALAFLCNAGIAPVDPKFHEKEAPVIDATFTEKAFTENTFAEEVPPGAKGNTRPPGSPP